MTMHQRQQDLCRVAIALNNMGAALLERQCHRQAHETLKDALIVARSIFHGLERDDLHPAMVTHKLQKAAHVMATPQPSNVHVPIGMLTDDSYNAHTALHCNPNAPSSSSPLIFSIRIEGPSDLEATTALDDLAGLVAYNFGVSFLCLAKIETSRQQSAHYLSNAMRIMKLCSQIVSITEETEPFSPAFVVAILRLKAMFEILNDSGRRADASVCGDMIEELRAEAHDYAMVFESGGPRIYPAPAA